jgi:hypothetical protein
MCIYLVLLALLAASLVGCEHDLASDLLQQGLQGDLALLFNANISSACERRCRLRATAAACAATAAPAVDDAGALVKQLGSSSAESDLLAQNSLVLSFVEAQNLTLAVEIICLEGSACTSVPDRFLAWQGKQCAADSLAAEQAETPLPASPVPGFHPGSGGIEQLLMLGTEHPAVSIFYDPKPPPLPATCEEQPAPPLPQTCSAPNNVSAAEETAGQAESAAPANDQPDSTVSHKECAGARPLLLKAALAVWLLGCTAVGARL